MGTSSSSQNTRIFAPTVILQEDTKRLQITLKTGESYSIDASITAGDCIRYNPNSNTYVRSSASSDETAEVIGVVESTSGTSYTVVTFGSINYPQARIDAILDGGDGGIDVLFLDNDSGNLGGLTGQVEIPTGANSALVKPVLQIAPHSGGNYNALVLNYIGYKIGNSASVPHFQPVGGIMSVPKDTDLGELGGDYLDMSVSHELTVADNPVLYSNFGVQNGSHIVDLVMTSSANLSTTLIGSQVTQNSEYGRGNIGTIIAVDVANKTVSIRRTKDTQSISTGYCFITNTTFNIESFSITKFSTPTKSPDLIGNTQFIYAINTTPVTTMTIPDSLNIATLSTNSLAVGDITDIEAKFADVQAQLDAIKLRIGMS